MFCQEMYSIAPLSVAASRDIRVSNDSKAGRRRKQTTLVWPVGKITRDENNTLLCNALSSASLAKAMTSIFQVCFCILLLKYQLRILHGLEVKPIKGETCSIGGGPSNEDENDEETPCFKEDGLYSSSNVRLTRRKGVALGHVENIQVDEENSVQLITRSLKPPLFEIPDFLSGEECDYLVQLAKRNGLEESTAGNTRNVVTRESVNATLTEKGMQFYCRSIKRFDPDKDGNISVHEFAGFVYRVTRMLVDLNELWNVYKHLLLEEAHAFTYENCTKVKRTSFVEFVYQLHNIKRLPYYNARYSRHSWVDFSSNNLPVIKSMKRRIAEVTQMSISQIDHSEHLQVINYQRSGHYHAHYDSTPGEDVKEKRCCRKFENFHQSACLLCRYITILFYLNDVEKGGETAFPVADREERLQAKNYTINLSRHCEKASLVMKPVKGTALFWYNNVLDEETGKMGEVDKLSLHGGCDVLEGDKWVANLWINAPRVDETV